MTKTPESTKPLQQTESTDNHPNSTDSIIESILPQTNKKPDQLLNIPEKNKNISVQSVHRELAELFWGAGIKAIKSHPSCTNEFTRVFETEFSKLLDEFELVTETTSKEDKKSKYESNTSKMFTAFAEGARTLKKYVKKNPDSGLDGVIAMFDEYDKNLGEQKDKVA